MTDKKHVKPTGGEGDRESARRYNDATKEFVESGKANKAPHPAGQPAESAEWAEREGKSRAKEFDPEVHRDYEQPTEDEK